MKNTLKNIALSLGLTFGFAVAAQAQAITNGTIDFSVTVPDAFDLRSNGAATNLVGVVASGNQTANDQLGVVLTVADASPNTNNTALTANVPIRIRSNRSYKVTALRMTQDGASPQDFDSSDIGMVVGPISRTGSAVATGTDTYANSWDLPGNTVGTLTGTAATLFSGPRISNQGDNDSTTNFATTSINFTIARQYYTPTQTTPTVQPFTQKVTLAIAAP